MKKILSSFVLCLMLGTLGLALGGLISKPFTFSPNTLIKSSEINANFDTLMNEFNGNISDANVSSSAAIQQSKVSGLVTALLAKLADTGDTITGELKSKYSTPCLRLTGTEGSAKDWQICESAGALIVQENTNTEEAPTWTTRYTLPAGADGPATGTDLTHKTYVDGLTSGLAFAKVTKTDGDFTTSSGMFVDVTGLTATITTGARRVRITYTGSIGATSVSAAMRIAPVVDGAVIMGTGGLLIDNGEFANNSRGKNASFSIVTDVLTAASHTIKLQVLTDVGTMRVMANAVNPAVWSVEELAH